jgi:hypothetical protein
VLHVCEHKCLATTKRCRGNGKEGVEDLISNSGNDYDDGKARFSESHYLFTCLLTVKIRQPSHEFTFGVGISFIPYPLVLTPVV